MDFAADEQQRMIQQAVRAFADGSVRDAAAGWDSRGELPAAALRELADLGLLGLAAPEDLGGSGLDARTEVAALEELATADAGLAQLVVQHHDLCLGHVLRAGTAAQRARYGLALASGKQLGCWAHGEDTANLDAATVRTTATRLDDGTWRLDGAKPTVLVGAKAALAVVTAQTPEGLTAFVVDLGAPGVQRKPATELLGLRSAGAADLVLSGVVVADEARLGVPGTADVDVEAVHDRAALGTAAVALGVARGALQKACRYAREREQFGKPIAQFQPIQWHVANSALDLETARALVQRAAWLLDQGKPASQAIAMARLQAGKAAFEVADRAIQVHGGYGYTTEFAVERAYRDAAVLQVLHGTAAWQRVRIARRLAVR